VEKAFLTLNCRHGDTLLIFPLPDERFPSMSDKTKNQATQASKLPVAPKVTPKATEAVEVVEDDRLSEWFTDVFVPQYGKQAGMALAAVAVAMIAWFSWNGIQEKSAQTSNRQLGKAYVYLTQNRLDSASAALLDVLHEGPGGLAEAKANLLLGKVRYGQARYDEALKAYEAVTVSSSSYPLVASGALHGMAACYMQKKDYTKAAAALETFVSDFGKRTGDPEEKLADKEVADPTPVMPNALWKLTLCYRELKNNEKAKATAEKLSRIYPASREGGDALRLLAQL
jgi:TolA-binding protein